MILIWRGAGILVVVIGIGSVVASDPLARALFGSGVSAGVRYLTGMWLAAALTLAFALVLRRVQRVDPENGPEPPVTAHSLFFIPVVAWPVIFFALGPALYLSVAPSGPPLVELSPRASERVSQAAAAKGSSRVWHFRMEAHWPKGEDAPQYKMDVVSGRAGEYDAAFETNGIRVAVPKYQADMFRGARVDLAEAGGEESFVVHNPNFEGEQLEKWRPVLESQRRPGAR
jgi:Fe-S cluster assembly iron-binding protein IscA